MSDFFNFITPDLPIIICTGFSEIMTPERVEQIGASGLLLKPISKNSMIKTLKDLFEQKTDDDS